MATSIPGWTYPTSTYSPTIRSRPTHMPATTSYTKTAECTNHALFLSRLGDYGPLPFFMLIILAVFSAFMTQWVRDLVSVPVGRKSTTTTTTGDESGVGENGNGGTSTIPSPDLEGNIAGGDEPPPYAPTPSLKQYLPAPIPLFTELHPQTTTPSETSQPSTSTIPSTTATTATGSPTSPQEQAAPTQPSAPPVKRSTAHLFVLGTFYTILNIFSLITLAFTIQCVLFCIWGNLKDGGTTLVYWFLFSIPATFSILGLTSWAMLFRNLFGPRASKKYPFGEYTGIKYLGLTILSPAIAVAVIFMLLGEGAISVLERCQGRWCPDSLLDREDEENGLIGVDRSARGDVELEMGDRGVEVHRVGATEEDDDDRRASGSTSVERDEERIGLLGGVEKAI